MRIGTIAWGLLLCGGCYSGLEQVPLGEGSSGGADQETTDGTEPGSDDEPQLEVGPVPMRRLTRGQYLQSTRDLLALPEWTPQIELPDEGLNEEEFQLPNMVAGTVTTGPVGYNRYRVAAKEAAAAAMGTDADMIQRLGCTPTGPEDPCVVAYLQATTERAFSRAIEDDDPVLQALLRIVVDANDRLGEVRLGVQWALINLLQSPEFLYFYPTDAGNGQKDAYSKARSLALMFRDSVPDATLIELARDGSLDDDDVLDAQIDRLIGEMLEQPERRGAVLRFFDDWWSMNVVEHVGKNAELFPEFDEQLRSAMKEEIDLWLQDILFERRVGFDTVFDADRIYVNDRLAQLYGLPGAFGDEFEAVPNDPESPRGGLLTTAAYLAVMAHPAQTSPAARGRFITERLMCLTIPPPPPNVDTTLPPPQGPETKRERFVRHTTDPVCAGCHQLMDPAGLALEEFDAIGRHRLEETVYFDGEAFDLPLDTNGELLGQPFANSRELGRILADSDELTHCVVRQLLRHQLGRELLPTEYVAVQELAEDFVEDDRDFVGLMRAMARHQVFTTFTEGE
ncbi:MAG: DUF1592 domain-containing protein [Myxococcota bacterium]